VWAEEYGRLLDLLGDEYRGGRHSAFPGNTPKEPEIGVSSFICGPAGRK
jgi:hypothetical protein